MKKIKFMTIFALMLLLLAACGLNQEGQDEQDQGAADDQTPVETEEFLIGVIPALTEGDYEVPMNKLEALLDEALNSYDVQIKVYPDYNGVVEALNFGHIQMAYLGPSTYVIANERSGAQAIITQLIEGKPFYHSYMITHVDAPYESLEDIIEHAEDIDFAFGDINSTSGSLVPSVELRERGVYTDENTYQFQSLIFTGSHDATGLSVQNKHVDAGAIDSAYYHSLINQGKLDGDQLKVVWESEPLFQYPWAVHADIAQETIETIQDTFVSIEDEEILRGFGATGFTLAEDKDYDAIRKVMRETGKID